jgi:hypothetical protein
MPKIGHNIDFQEKCRFPAVKGSKSPKIVTVDPSPDDSQNQVASFELDLNLGTG